MKRTRWNGALRSLEVWKKRVPVPTRSTELVASIECSEPFPHSVVTHLFPRIVLPPRGTVPYHAIQPACSAKHLSSRLWEGRIVEIDLWYSNKSPVESWVTDRRQSSLSSCQHERFGYKRTLLQGAGVKALYLPEECPRVAR